MILYSYNVVSNLIWFISRSRHTCGADMILYSYNVLTNIIWFISRSRHTCGADMILYSYIVVSNLIWFISRSRHTCGADMTLYYYNVVSNLIWFISRSRHTCGADMILYSNNIVTNKIWFISRSRHTCGADMILYSYNVVSNLIWWKRFPVDKNGTKEDAYYSDNFIGSSLQWSRSQVLTSFFATVFVSKELLIVKLNYLKILSIQFIQAYRFNSKQCCDYLMLDFFLFQKQCYMYPKFDIEKRLMS